MKARWLGHPIFIWHGFCEKVATTFVKVKLFLDSSNPTSFHAKIKVFIFFCACKRNQKRGLHDENFGCDILV